MGLYKGILSHTPWKCIVLTHTICPFAGRSRCMVRLGMRAPSWLSIGLCCRCDWYRRQLDDWFEIRHLSASILAESRTMLLVIKRDHLRQWQLLAMVHLARSVGSFSRRCCRLHNILFLLHNLGIVFRVVECVPGAHVRPIRVRFGYSGNQDDFVRLHYSRLFGQMDVAG